MGKGGEGNQYYTKGTKKTHHCPGANGRVGEESPGNCDWDTTGVRYCKKHQLLCLQGCRTGTHLKNQTGCTSCLRRWGREDKEEREAKENQKAMLKKEAEDSFWNPPKDRKRSRSIAIAMYHWDTVDGWMNSSRF
jgi:hypothetical protein